MTNDHQRRLGERLRAIRQHQRLTLQQVEHRSGGRWKAVVVGSYERGDRSISLARLAELTTFYGVPLGEILPGATPSPAATASKAMIDLVSLARASDQDPWYQPIFRFVTTIQVRRGDYNGRVLTLREGDLEALAVALDRDRETLHAELLTAGLLR